jgi:hypothetical protein
MRASAACLLCKLLFIFNTYDFYVISVWYAGVYVVIAILRNIGRELVGVLLVVEGLG